jgi:hypothetical protein
VFLVISLNNYCLDVLDKATVPYTSHFKIDVLDQIKANSIMLLLGAGYDVLIYVACCVDCLQE